MSVPSHLFLWGIDLDKWRKFIFWRSSVRLFADLQIYLCKVCPCNSFRWQETLYFLMWYTVAQSRIERRRVCRLPKSRLSSETDRLVLKTVRIGSFRNVAMEHERNVYWSADWRFFFLFLIFLLLFTFVFIVFSFFSIIIFSCLHCLFFLLFSLIIFSFLHCLFFLSYFLLLFFLIFIVFSFSFFFYEFLFSSLSFSFSFFRFFNHYFLISSREKMGCRKHELYLGLELTKRALTR